MMVDNIIGLSFSSGSTSQVESCCGHSARRRPNFLSNGHLTVEPFIRLVVNLSALRQLSFQYSFSVFMKLAPFETKSSFSSSENYKWGNLFTIMLKIPSPLSSKFVWFALRTIPCMRWNTQFLWTKT